MQIMKFRRLLAILVAVGALALATTAQAQTVGPGVGILELPGANNAVDTPSDGTTDQSRQNLDQSFTTTLSAGEWMGTTWTFRAGQAGSVIPYLAQATGPDSYTIVAVGDQVDVTAEDLDMDMVLPFGGSGFTLTGDTEIFGGITNPQEAGSQNPIYTNLNSGGFMDHDNNADGMLSPAVVGGAVDGFGHANLARSYAFAIDVRVVPEPTSIFAALTAFGLTAVMLRGRRTKK
jgi:hypothetical protein